MVGIEDAAAMDRVNVSLLDPTIVQVATGRHQDALTLFVIDALYSIGRMSMRKNMLRKS